MKHPDFMLADFIRYLEEQFPATIGHHAIRVKLAGIVTALGHKVAPAAEPPRDLKEVHATESPKPPYGFRLVDKVKDAPKLDTDLYFRKSLGVWGLVEHLRCFEPNETYTRAINPGPGYRLLREDEPLPEEKFERFAPSGRWLKSSKCGDENCCPKNMKAKDWADDPKNHTLAIRVPCEPVSQLVGAGPIFTKPKPIITDAACKNCNCWLCSNWTHCAYCGTARNPELPKPIGDLSGLPEIGYVLIWGGGHWSAASAKDMRESKNSPRFTHWQPQPSAPVPPPKSQDEIDRDAALKWVASYKMTPERMMSVDCFTAGIAHARKQGEGK